MNKSHSCRRWWIIRDRNMVYESSSSEFEEMVLKAVLQDLSASVKGCSSFWFLACGSWREVGDQQGCWEFVHGEKPSRISWNDFIHSFIFSCAFLIYKPEVWIAFLPDSLTKQSWQEKKKSPHQEREWATVAEKWLKRIISICPR